MMRKFLLAGMVLLFLSACGSGSNGSDRDGNSGHMGGGDPMSGSGAGGNTNHMGTDTMRGMTMDTGMSATPRDTFRIKKN